MPDFEEDQNDSEPHVLQMLKSRLDRPTAEEKKVRMILKLVDYVSALDLEILANKKNNHIDPFCEQQRTAALAAVTRLDPHFDWYAALNKGAQSVAPRVKRQTSRVRSMVLGVVGIGALGAAGVAFSNDYSNNLQDGEQSICDVSQDSSTANEPEVCDEDEVPCVASPIEASTLYGKVEAVAFSQEALSSYPDKTTTQLQATSTNALVSELYAGADTWEDLDGRWKDSTAAYTALTKKLETWGGYDAVLDSLSYAPLPISTIDGALAHLASDQNLPNSQVVALELAKQIALIKDARIATDLNQVKADLAKLTPEKVESTVIAFVDAPPPSPAHFEYPSGDVTDAQLAVLYDAPEPANVRVPELSRAMLTAQEMNLQSDHDVPEPRFVQAPVVANSVNSDDAVIEAFFKAGDAMNSASVPAPEPAKTFTEKAKDTVKGWGKKLTGWFS